MRMIAIILAIPALAACVSYPADRAALAHAGTATPPATLSVMTYIIEGLTWPTRSGRGPFLKAIRTGFEQMERAGILPDVIVFQEAFSSSALRTAASTAHPAFALGPRAPTRSGLPKTRGAVRQSDDPRVAAAAVFSVIRNVSVPYGVSMADAPNRSTTRWRVVADHKGRRFYVEPAE